MNSERIATYDVEDFIIDDDFRKILKTAHDDGVLANLVLNFPEKEYEIKFADEILKALHVSNFTQTTQRKEELWNKIKKELL